MDAETFAQQWHVLHPKLLRRAGLFLKQQDDAEIAVGNVLLYLLKSLHRLPTAEQGFNLRAYCFWLLQRHAMHQHNKAQKRPPTEPLTMLMDGEEFDSYGMRQKAMEAHRETERSQGVRAEAESLLMQIPDPIDRLILAGMAHGHTCEAIGQYLNFSKQRVSQRAHRTRERLRNEGGSHDRPTS